MRKFIDIESMSNDQWIAYREGLLADFLSKGHKLSPTIECPMCDPDNNYTCFECEIYQLAQRGIE